MQTHFSSHKNVYDNTNNKEKYMNTTDYRITKTYSEYIKQNHSEWLMSYAIMKNPMTHILI